MDSIITDLLELNCSGNIIECIELIENALVKNPQDRLYLLIHNIDGIMLRSNKVQDLLSCLASIPNIRILASVDHINAPLCMINLFLLNICYINLLFDNFYIIIYL